MKFFLQKIVVYVYYYNYDADPHLNSIPIGSANLSIEHSENYFKIDLIDADSQKWEMQYLSNSIPIISPEQIKDNKIDLIIIASMYSSSIMKTIKKMQYNCSTLLLSS